ncbi:MAG: hypothetical protein AB7D07_12315 [Desulfovibrionaceae bacterium]
MHFEILVEDQSGKKALDILVPKIIDAQQHSFRVISYKGVGRIPKNLHKESDASKRILLDQLPRLLRGYGKIFTGYPPSQPAAVIVVCDLDDKCLKSFREELEVILNDCAPKPETRFIFAVEEGEAWFLGDISAIKLAYPSAKDSVLRGYVHDSVCGTWELLANALYRGGADALSARGWQAVGAEKSAWAEKISPYMKIENNISPSFVYFLKKIRELANTCK